MSITSALTELNAFARPLSYEQLLVHLSRNGIAGALRRGEIVRVLPDAYAGALHAESWLLRAQAASRWLGADVAISGRMALFAAGALTDAPERLDLVLPWGTHVRRPPWVRIRTTTWPVDARPWGGLFRVVPAALALLLAHEAEPPSTRASLVHDAMRSGRIDPEELAHWLSHVPRLGGRRQLETRLALISRGAESFLEERAHHKVLTGKRLSRMIRQHRLVVGSHRFRADAYDEATRTVAEFDGEARHGSWAAHQADSTRDAVLATQGIQTVRFTYRDVTREPAKCRATLLAVLRERER